MKKLCMLMAVVLLFSFAFTSCGLFKPSDAEAMEKRIDKRMNQVSSYKIEEEMTMVFYTSGKRVDASSTGEIIGIDDKSDDNYYYQRVDTRLLSTALNLDKQTTSILAYNEGNMFSLNTGNNYNQKLYSPIEFEEFLEVLEEMLGSEFIYSDCGKSEVERSEDGGWILNCSEYSKEKTEVLIEELGLGGESFNFDAKDVNVTIECDKKFRIEKRKIVFVFDESDKKPAVEIESKYQYEDITRVVDLINPDDYKKTDNLRLIYDLDSKLDAMADAEEGAFDIAFSTGVSHGTHRLSTEGETDSVKYGIKDGKYYYDMTSLKSGDKYTIVYEDGTKTSTSKTNYVNTTPQTDLEAKAYISSLIRASGYSYAIVNNIKEAKDGIYTFECQVPMSDYRDMLKTLGLKYSSSSYEITVKLDDEGEIKEINSDLIINTKSGTKNIVISNTSKLRVKTSE